MNTLSGVVSVATIMLIDAADRFADAESMAWYDVARRQPIFAEQVAANAVARRTRLEMSRLPNVTARSASGVRPIIEGLAQIQRGLEWAVDRIWDCSVGSAPSMISALATAWTATTCGRRDNRIQRFEDLDPKPRPNIGRTLQQAWWQIYKRYTLPWHWAYLAREDTRAERLHPALHAWRAMLLINREKAYDLFWRAVEREAPEVLVRIDQQDVEAIFKEQ